MNKNEGEKRKKPNLQKKSCLTPVEVITGLDW